MKIFFAILAVALAAFGYFQFFYPPTVLKRATASQLQQFSDAVATQDRTKVTEVLGTMLTDDAKIRLEVTFLHIIQQNNTVWAQDFDKVSFTAFIDNLLYTTHDYNYIPRLANFALSEDRSQAAVTFTSKEWADGNAYYGGIAVDSRFSSETECEGQVRFENQMPRLSQATCKIGFRSVPKPGAADKLKNSESLRDLLLKQ